MSSSAAGATAAAMDRMYRHQRHLYDATRKFYLLGRDGVLDALAPPAGAHILEIGCGTGRNLLRLARRYPDAILFGLDASQEMLATARRNIAQAGLERRVFVAQGLAESLDGRLVFGEETGFDAILISYVLTMIPNWALVVERAAANLAPCGRLGIVDFWDQRGLPAWFARALRGWLSLFGVRPASDMPQRIRGLLQPRGGRQQLDSLYGGYAFRILYRAPG